jgi:hypothetical protein
MNKPFCILSACRKNEDWPFLRLRWDAFSFYFEWEDKWRLCSVFPSSEEADWALGSGNAFCDLQRLALRDSLLLTPRLGDTSHTINDLIPRRPAEAKNHDTRSQYTNGVTHAKPPSFPCRTCSLEHRRVNYYNIYFGIQNRLLCVLQ